MDKLQDQLQALTKGLQGQKVERGSLLASMESQQKTASNQVEESLGGQSSLQDNELAFQSLRAKQKLQKNLATNSQVSSKSLLRDPLTQHQNLLNLVTEIDHQLKALEQRLTNKISDRDEVLERMEIRMES